MIPIERSPVAEYFDDFSSDQLAEVAWLDGDEAARVWRQWGEASARHLYELPSNHWSLVVEWKTIGGWLETFNEGERLGEVPDLLLEASGWSAGQRVVMIQSSKNILAMTMRAFRVCWRGTLWAFDDGPLLVPEGTSSGPVFFFRPIGDIRFAHRRSAPEVQET